MSEWIAIAAGGMVSVILLLALHLGLWSVQHRVHRVASYTVGVAALNLGVTFTAVLLNSVLLFATVWIISGMGGVTIATCWWLRGVLAERIDNRTANEHLVERLERGPTGRSDHRRN